ncbi:DMT family transporter [Bacillus sp. B15-48]|uniref:DMT family transporter n=1 Tax=Bacillus sp. B15-48 TaxID=1548601 RepID=UPI00193F439A|nr:DMT family transporter [Bacillus sp. B15-48]MBM4764812.1 EamA family transporter [Bacillus sp. B15-48]
MSNNRLSFLGILFGMIAGAAWGLAFLIPNILSSFSSLEITLGRYFMYGSYSLLLFMIYKTNPLHIPARVWSRALLYAFTGNIGYFFFLVLGIKYAGATITALIIGTLPIVISFVGNLLNKEFPFKILLIPACLILIGIFLLSSSGQGDVSSLPVTKSSLLLGFLCCFIALALWTWYGISNANFLKKETEVTPNLFSTIVGIQTLTLVGFVLLISKLTNQQIMSNLIVQDGFMEYLIGIIVLGIIASWVATWAWNQTSIRLTVSIAGMMIVFETIFGLLYSFVYYATFPTILEWVSIIFILQGITFGIWKINRHRIAEQK